MQDCRPAFAGPDGSGCERSTVQGIWGCKRTSAAAALLFIRICELRSEERESQRDSGPKPSIARNELPWENVATRINPQRGCSQNLFRGMAVLFILHTKRP